jgi:hypothetical protein
MKMLRSNLALSLFCLLIAPAAQAQVYSGNIVGYYNRSVFAGDNLIANQLGTTNDTLNNVLTLGVLNGSMLTEWDPGANQFLPASTFNAATASWSINYPLTYGGGALFYSPASAAIMFAGEVDPALVSTANGLEINFANWQPNYANGLYLLSCPVPIDGATFQEVVGRDPLNGEWVETLNEASQTCSVTTFHTGTGWDNGAPALDVGQAAFFDLGPVVVPEPSTLTLAVLGVAALVRFRRRSCNSQA